VVLKGCIQDIDYTMESIGPHLYKGPSNLASKDIRGFLKASTYIGMSRLLFLHPDERLFYILFNPDGEWVVPLKAYPTQVLYYGKSKRVSRKDKTIQDMSDHLWECKKLGLWCPYLDIQGNIIPKLKIKKGVRPFLKRDPHAGCYSLPTSQYLKDLPPRIERRPLHLPGGLTLVKPSGDLKLVK
jgi:hypothetical protein